MCLHSRWCCRWHVWVALGFFRVRVGHCRETKLCHSDFYKPQAHEKYRLLERLKNQSCVRSKAWDLVWPHSWSSAALMRQACWGQIGTMNWAGSARCLSAHKNMGICAAVHVFEIIDITPFVRDPCRPHWQKGTFNMNHLQNCFEAPEDPSCWSSGGSALGPELAALVQRTPGGQQKKAEYTNTSSKQLS